MGEGGISINGMFFQKILLIPLKAHKKDKSVVLNSVYVHLEAHETKDEINT